MPSLIDLVEMVRDDGELFGEAGPCPVLVESGDNPRVLLVTGGNAGGKSLVCRFMEANSRDEARRRVGFMRIGMGKRTESGMHRAFMFGEEDRESTGRISTSAVLGAIKACRGSEDPHFLCLDEPDIGLSEEMQAGMGDLLAGFALDLPASTLGLVVVTHSRPLAREVLRASPWCVRAGDDRRPTREWATSPPVPASAADVMALPAASTARLRAVQGVLNARSEARRAPAAPVRRGP